MREHFGEERRGREVEGGAQKSRMVDFGAYRVQAQATKLLFCSRYAWGDD